MLQFHSRIVDYLFPKSNNSTLLFPAVYGIRAIGIIVVVLKALNIPFIKGGSLGYSILFVVSGYLITESMMRRIEKENKLDLVKFYKNRASKIFPSLVLMVLIFSILLAIFRRSLLPQFRADFITGLLGFENWWQIFKYGNLGAESPLGFLWALSAVIQMIIVWSLILWCIHSFLKDDRMPLIAAGALALISFVLMAVLYNSETPARALLGTDTRCFSFFIGAALACYTGNPRDRIWEYPVFIMDILGVVSMIALVLMVVLSSESKMLSVGFNLLASLFTACILLSAFRPSSVLARFLGFTPFSLIGKASYGIYLWHMPFILLLRLENGGKWWVILIALILMGIMAAVNARFVEGPIRRGVIADTYRIIDGTPKSTYEKQEYKRAIAKTRIALIVGLMLLLLSLISIFLISNNAGENGGITPSNQGGNSGAQGENNEGGGEEAYTLPKSFNDTNTLFVGDEFALNAQAALIDNIPNITADIAASRYSTSAGPIFEAYSNGGWEGDIVILSLSHAGELYDSLDDIRGRMRESQLLFIVNDRGSDWEQSNNSTISEFVNSNDNTYAIDWYGASENHPEYFDTEVGGLSQEGAAQYADLVKITVEAVLNN